MRLAVLATLAACALSAMLAPASPESFLARQVADFGASPLETMTPSQLELELGLNPESLPTMYPLVPGLPDTPRPPHTRMTVNSPTGPCDCPLGRPQDSVCLYSNGQAFTNDCVAKCWGHKPREYYSCKVKIPLFRKLN